MNDLPAIFWTWLAPVAQSPMGLLTIALALILGYMLKGVPFIPNYVIPWAVIPCAGWLFARLGNPGLVPPEVVEITLALVGYGIVLGFLAWMLHALLLKRLEEKLGLFAPSPEPPKPPT